MSAVWLDVAFRVGAGVVFLLCCAYLFRNADPAKTLLAIGGALLSLAARWSDITKYIWNPPAQVLPWLVTVGVVFAIAGLAWLAFKTAADHFVTFAFSIGGHMYRWRAARAGELVKIHEYAVKLFGPDVSPVTSMRAWRQRYSRAFLIMEEQRSSQCVMRGYYCLLPLTSVAVSLLEAEELDGTSISADHIEPVRDRVAGAYVGAIAADGLFARGALIHHMNGRLSELDETGMPVYARPVTTTGLRTLKRQGFSPVDALVGPRDLARMYVRRSATTKIVLKAAP